MNGPVNLAMLGMQSLPQQKRQFSLADLPQFQMMQAPQNGPGQFMPPMAGPGQMIGGGPSVQLPGAPTMPQNKQMIQFAGPMGMR